jgi:hypothetical protein
LDVLNAELSAAAMDRELFLAQARAALPELANELIG